MSILPEGQELKDEDVSADNSITWVKDLSLVGHPLAFDFLTEKMQKLLSETYDK